MTVRVGSGIVKDGLILHLDVADTLNYLLSTVEVLVVGGGGGGGVCYGGGGGGGGVLYNNAYSVTPGSAITVTVGAGGAPGTYNYTSGGDGGNSVFGGITAIGGGGGGHYDNNNGRTGGSGGGGGGSSSNTYGLVSQGGSGTYGQGNRGGRGGGVPSGLNYRPGGGGGGAGEPGYDYDVNLGLGGKGGDGLPFNISGRMQYYGGGGGGHTDGRSFLNSTSMGGKGGGGRGGNYGIPRRGLDGAANTGGGGGGSYGTQSGYECGTGGTGIVIVRYPGPQKATGGNTITQVDGYTIHTFTTTGSSTFTPLSTPTNGSTVYGLQDLSENYQTAVAGGTVTYNSANSGYLVFNGSSYLNITDTPALRPESGRITVNCWFMTTVVGSENVDIVYNKENEYELSCGGGYLSIAFRPDWNWRRVTAINTNTWYCSTVTYDGNTQIVYVNGTSAYTSTVGSGLGQIYVNDLRIAARNAPSTATSLMTGRVGIFQIYNRALTATEVLQNFNAQRARYGV